MTIESFRETWIQLSKTDEQIRRFQPFSDTGRVDCSKLADYPIRADMGKRHRVNMRKLVYLGLVMAAFLLLPAVYAAPSFSISASPTSLIISAGNSGSSIITLGSNGFSGTIQLSSAVNPNNPTVTTTLNPASVSLSPGGSAQSTLTVTTTPFTPLGTYTVTVTGTSGSTSNTTPVTVTVISGTVGGVAVQYQSAGSASIGLGLVAFGAVVSICACFSGIKSLSAKRNRI